MDLQELDPETFGALLTGSRQDIEDYLDDTDLPLNDMAALREAESAGRDRDRVLDLLDDRIIAITVARELDVAEDDVDAVKSIIDRVADLEDVDGDVPDEYDTLDQEAVLDLMGGTIDDLEAFLDDRALSASQVAYLLEAEQKVKDRKTAKRLLRDEMHDRVLAEDMARVRDDVRSLRSDVSGLEADAAGDIDPERVDAARVEAADAVDYEAIAQENIEDIKQEVNSRDLDLEALLDAETANKDRVTLKEWLREQIAQQPDEPDTPSEDADVQEDDMDEPEDDAAEEAQEDEDVEDDAADDDMDAEPDGEESEDMGERAELIDDLVAQFDYPRDRFDDMTIDDLRKIHDNLTEDAESGVQPEDTAEQVDIDTDDIADMAAAETMDGKGSGAKSGAEQGKDLMGQLNLIDLKKNFGGPTDDEDEEEEQEDDEVAKRGLVSRLVGQVRGHAGGTDGRSLQETALEDLERAKELDDDHRAALLVAHVMKQFLEVKMDIPRELTYLEVAAELGKSGLDTEHEDAIREFYQRMHFQEYKGDATVDVDEAYALAEQVIQDLS